MPQGKIIRALSGFYYIESSHQVYQTRARGVFRKRGQSPLVGDIVDFTSDSLEEGVLEKIYPRKNALVRPPISNVDIGVVVMSAVEPDFSTHLVDRFLVYLEGMEIQPVLLITKVDLLNEEQLQRLEAVKKKYQEVGYEVWYSSEVKDHQSEFLASYKGKLVVFLGQSGVGKSTMLNQLIPELNQETGEISSALGRGKHTTRQVSLHEVEEVWIADTPGFSTVDFIGVEKEDLPHLFPEFEEYSTHCKFRECSHQHEPHCGVQEAVKEGKIWQERYDHYQDFYEEISQRKPMYQRKK